MIESAGRAEFVAEALRRLGRLRLRVHGESMLPALWPGDVVDIATCSLGDLRPGEIVLALRDGRLFLHRLVDPGAMNGFRLRGDSLPGSDPIYPRPALLGRLVRGSNAPPGFCAVTLYRALGVFLCHCGIARRLVLKLHSKRSVNELQTLEAS